MIVVENDRLITTEGYYIQKIGRARARIWKHNTPDEDRRVAINPNFGGGYVFTVGEGDRIEFRDVEGTLLRDFSRLSDDTGASMTVADEDEPMGSAGAQSTRRRARQPG